MLWIIGIGVVAAVWVLVFCLFAIIGLRRWVARIELEVLKQASEAANNRPMTFEEARKRKEN